MSDNNISENLVGVEELLKTLAGSCLKAAQQVELSDTPGLNPAVRYIVPSFKVSVKLSFTKTGNEVKGILFWKRSEGESSQALSSIDMEIVAVPRTQQT